MSDFCASTTPQPNLDNPVSAQSRHQGDSKEVRLPKDRFSSHPIGIGLNRAPQVLQYELGPVGQVSLVSELAVTGRSVPENRCFGS